MIGFFVIVAWFSCGYAAAAATRATSDFHYKETGNEQRETLALCCLFYLSGPVALAAIFFATGFFQNGFDWKWWKA